MMSSPSNNFLLRNPSLCVQDCLLEVFYCYTPQTLLTLSSLIKSVMSLCLHAITVMPAAIDIFCRWFLYKMQNIWRPGILSEEEILASHADTADRVTNGMTERERDVKLRPLCLERNLQWFYGQLNYTAPEHK